ncbi:MAG: CRISPR-associated helicase Cas3' [Nitrospirae bacterium]|nr:MAG: CRISPR-associated helicase Cas3' [Nitrospirota bacterium]
MGLLSHPHLQFREHVQQVLRAMEGIFTWHTSFVVTERVQRQCRVLARVHDLGKGTKAFQHYIRNPDAFQGDRREKTHTPLSVLLIVLFAQRDQWAPLETLAMAASSRGHHSELPTMDDLRDIGGGEMAKLLKRQCSMLHLAELKEATGMPVDDLNFNDRPWAKVRTFLDKTVKPVFDALPLEQAIEFRLEVQLLFSILLEADKAFLAVADPITYLHREPRVWDPQWVDARIGCPAMTPINELRWKARQALLKQIDQHTSKRLFQLTAPTGIGKTLLAATWALKERLSITEQSGVAPKIIVVLPFLSIIDQTAKEYEALLRQGNQHVDGSWFLASHSLSDRQYALNMEEEVETFFIDTWRTELVITTYDQFLLTLMSPKARHQMRFHNLCDALIILDEVQSLPCKLWKPLERLLSALTNVGHSRVLFMSATLPSLLAEAVPLLPDHESFFRACRRYRILFRAREKMLFQDFIEELQRRLPLWLRAGKRVLLVLNTRASARAVRDALEDHWPCECRHVPLLFISADVTPLDRLRAIQQIAMGGPCIVVSTQCVEAGVDIDMDHVIRDFAPLDSCIQVAGRCNRAGNQERGTVEVVDLVAGNGRRFSDMIYDPIHLQETRRVLSRVQQVNEEDILPLIEAYYAALAEKKNLGNEHVERFARWENDEPVRDMLRGKEREEVTFLVLDQDARLKQDMAAANQLENRWKRREAWRKLSGRIARISVTLYAKKGFVPEDIAYPLYGQWILKDGYYDPRRGLLLPSDDNDPGVVIL